MAPYANIPADVFEEEGRRSHSRALGVASVLLTVLAIVGVFALLSPTSLSRRPLRGSILEVEGDIAVVSGTCSEIWGQCGGDGYDGPTCCETGSACKHKKVKGFPSYHQCVPDKKHAPDKKHNGGGSRGRHDGDKDSTSCSQLWGQCGGEGYSGPSCCEEGTACSAKPLANLPSYKQCIKSAPSVPKHCAEPEEGSICMDQLRSDMGAVSSQPGSFHGITADMDLKEFQMFEHLWNFNNTFCPEPCAPGTCYFVLHVEGCDTLNTWYCEEDDNSLKYACCCKYYHKEKNLTKPAHPDPDMANAMQAVGASSPKFFCTAMCMPRGYELGLLRSQLATGKLGLFGCNEWEVYSNESLRLSLEGHYPLVMTELINGSLSAEMGGHWGTALNTEVFIRFWKKLMSRPKVWECDWIIKVDPDTMWLPDRLRALLHTTKGALSKPETKKGRYLNNCHVGLHGPIEVLSRRALETYKEGMHQCQTDPEVSKIGQEDFWLSECFKLLGVEEVKAYNLMLEATLACQEVPSAIDPDRPPCFSPQVAFHPFKSIHTWMHCHEEASNHPWALPTVPVTEGPNDANERHG